MIPSYPLTDRTKSELRALGFRQSGLSWLFRTRFVEVTVENDGDVYVKILSRYRRDGEANSSEGWIFVKTPADARRIFQTVIDNLTNQVRRWERKCADYGEAATSLR